MKTLYKFGLVFSLILFSQAAFSQDNGQLKNLIDQGVALNDSGKYAEAINKYHEALKIDSTSIRAQYELSYTLTVSGKSKEAVPYLEKVTASNQYAEAFDLIASIYDDEGNFEKSTAYYKQGLLAFPNYQRLHFNLAISYYRQKKFAEAETSSIDAIKLDPKHASSQRVYALATYSLKKSGASLLAWCSFLLLEPQSKRSTEAYNYIDNILHSGISKTGANKINISISPDDPSSLMMPMAILAATEDKKGLSAVDSLQLQLTSLFKISHTIIGKNEPPFIIKYYGDYFNKLANTDNMPAFARLISLSAHKKESIQWFKDNDEKLKALDLWVRTTERKY